LWRVGRGAVARCHRGGVGLQVVGRVVVPAGCRTPRQVPQRRRPGLPASTTKSNSRTWRGRGVCDHFTQCCGVLEGVGWGAVASGDRGRAGLQLLSCGVVAAGGGQPGQA
jgi:hypothetical protein